MRKQTKLVAVLSASVLLAIGTSMASFAATGWIEENGTWVYYDGNGEKATDELIENGDYYYYVDENGAMVTNRWVPVANEEVGNDNQPQQWWYYFQKDGKAMRGPQDNSLSLKTIDGKKYAFGSDGKMLYGWIKTDDATIISDEDDAWQTADYYFGDENDGAMTVGWKQLDITDPNAADADQKLINPEFTDMEDQSRFFYFRSNGKKAKGTSDELKESTINGKIYGFDEYGRMITGWSFATESDSTSTAESSRNWKYFGDIESGARVTKGWFEAVPAEALNKDDYDDGSTGWYYAGSNGNIYAGEIKTIDGKKYAFNENGKMITGLKFLKITGSAIDDVRGNDVAGYEFDTVDAFDMNAGKSVAEGFELYYFGDDDGAMKTGTTSVEIDGEKFNFLFGKSGRSKGVGLTGEDNKKLYNAGKLMTAGKDEKYQAVVGVGTLEYYGYQKIEDAATFAAQMDGASFNFKEVIDARHYSAWTDVVVKELADELGIEVSDVKRRTGLTNTNDKYSDITIYITETKTGVNSLGITENVKLVNTSGKVSDKNAKNKDGSDIVNISLHFFLKDVRTMQHPLMRGNIVVS